VGIGIVAAIFRRPTFYAEPKPAQDGLGGWKPSADPAYRSEDCDKSRHCEDRQYERYANLIVPAVDKRVEDDEDDHWTDQSHE
jgi:hypothetical protein